MAALQRKLTTPASQRGSGLVMFLAMMLPLMFVLLSLSLDLSKFLADKEQAQRKLDEAAIQAVKFLPHRKAAIEAAMFYLKRSGVTEDGSGVEISVTSEDMVEITKKWEISNLFAAYLIPESATRTAVFSRARSIPFDSLIFLDRSAYMAPVIGPDGSGSSWDEKSSTFFSENAFKILGKNINPALLTDQCFNADFTTLKKIAVRLYRNFAGFAQNAVGVSVFPGNGAPVTVLRDVLPSGENAANGFGEAYFAGYAREYGHDEYCAAVAKNESLHKSEFDFPKGDTSIDFVWKEPAGKPSMVDAKGLFNPAYTPYLSVVESMWSQVTHRITGQMDLVLLHSLSVLKKSDLRRKSLSDKSKQTVLIVAGDVPWVEITDGEGTRMANFSGDDSTAPLADPTARAARVTANVSLVKEKLSAAFNVWKQVLEESPGYSLRLYYVMPVMRNIDAVDYEVQELQRFFDAESEINGKRDGRLSLKVMRPLPGLSADEVADSVVSGIVLDRRAALLSR